jgi:hypothetical protein
MARRAARRAAGDKGVLRGGSDRSAGFSLALLTAFGRIGA